MRSSYSVGIGRTNLFRLCEIEKYFGIKQRLYGKAEYQNPTGSLKDRAAFTMLESLFELGGAKEGVTVVEATSGNLGISIAMLSSVMRFRSVIIMPDTYSVERRRIISAYGGEIVLVRGGMDEACRLCREMVESGEADFSLSQFDNPLGIEAHFRTTAPEIYYSLFGSVSAVVAGVGSGATLSGIGRFFKNVSSETKIIATEPLESNILSGGSVGVHGISGIGAGFVPKNLDLSVCDRIIDVSTEIAREMSRILAKREGMLVGPSSGAAVYAALEYARECKEGENIVAILADRGERYISEGLYK